MQAAVADGYKEDYDMNNPDSTGVGPIPMNNPGGVRMSTALTYLNPVRHRLNLTVRSGVTVRRVMFQGKRATGVELERGGESFQVEGSELNLCGGAIGAPRLRRVSGVGPEDQLREMGSRGQHALAGVGQNVRGHRNVRIPVRVKEDLPLDPEAPRTQLALRYTAAGSKDRNDMQILQSSFSSPMGGDPLEGEGIRFTCIVELAVGAGELKMASTDPHVQPDLNYGYLENAWDRERLREGVRLCLKLLESESYQSFVEECISPTAEDLVSDGALDQWLLRNVTTTQHISGTCKMGPDSDPMAVVDQYCHVHGLEGLRVVDVSVLPDCIRANTNATTIMIAERVADWMK